MATRRGAEAVTLDDFTAAVTCALDDRIEAFLRRPAHLDEVRQRDAGDGGIARQRHHGIPVSTHQQRADVFDADTQLHRHKSAHAG